MASEMKAQSRHPIQDLLELLGRRWALRVLWELRDGPLGFSLLRQACEEVSTSVLAQRLRELDAAGLVRRSEHGYELTDDGRELGVLLLRLDAFARERSGSTSEASI